MQQRRELDSSGLQHTGRDTHTHTHIPHHTLKVFAQLLLSNIYFTNIFATYSVDQPLDEDDGDDKISTHLWASLVVQRLRICLPMQGTRVRALVWEDPTCRGVTRPVSHNY